MQEMEYRGVLEQLRKEMEELCLVNAEQQQCIFHLQDELKRTLRHCHRLEQQLQLAVADTSPKAAGAEKKTVRAATKKNVTVPLEKPKEKKTSIVNTNKAAAVSAKIGSPEKVRQNFPRWKMLMRKFHANPYSFFQESKYAFLRPLRHLYSPK